MGRGILYAPKPQPRRSKRPQCARRTPAPALLPPGPREKCVRGAPSPLPAPVQPAPPRHRRPTFHGDGGDAPPAWELRAAKKVRAEQRSLRAHGSRASASALEPSPAAGRAPCSALCAAGPPRAPLTPGGRRRARQRPSPGPRARALPRPPRPRACSPPAQSLSRLASPRPRPRSPGFLFPLDPRRSEVSWAV